MKKMRVKRLVYRDWTGAIMAIGDRTYDIKLDEYNILNSIHEINKTIWINDQLWLLDNGNPKYYILVEPFYQYEKHWYELLIDAIRRI